ncbi:acyclic terpene utilization AtuA family protein [Marmoricola sp. URHB0036]|uniref:acyclic terpene utilization AtuA family protein n=1 Tax=Marmoricola sp. URHB0036 TaxID=1298863 RepID=UPI00041466D5|nr:acyclic terpene utilization AtuA family protein [Marmoricola sp. URHB0036]
MSDTLRIGNCSGFYGDRLSAMREMVEGGVDVVTGDYLAELTMLILGKDQLKDPSLGYARTFVTQVGECLGTALEKGVRIVANAGGLNPAGLVDKLQEVAEEQGLSPRIAWVDGDNLAPRAAELGFGGALTANAYLGAFGIARALEAGADIVVTGRVTDASVVVGPAIWKFGWAPEQYDELAGAVVAGHVIECGTQATGGNFSGFLDLPRDAHPLGFPIAEISADGSSVITKHDGTGGLVSVDTVTAQLMYEVQSTHYLGPDVTVDLSTIELAPDGPDRVRVSGTRGLAPPHQLKVCVNELGGFRNQLEFVLTGLDLEEKAAWLRAQLGGRIQAASVTWSMGQPPAPDSESEEGASVLLRCVVKDDNAAAVGKPFTAAAIELALASYPGFTLTAPPGAPSPYGIYRPAYVDRDVVEHTVHLPDGSSEVVQDPQVARQPEPETKHDPASTDSIPGIADDAITRRVPLGTFVHARSGDKGGDANVGLWVRAGERQTERSQWLRQFVTVDHLRTLLPEAKDLDIEVFELTNLHGVNVLVHGLLGDGVAASTRFDPQAKGLGEWLRSRLVNIPEELL